MCSDNYWLHYSRFENGRGRDFSLQTGFGVGLAYYPVGSEVTSKSVIMAMHVHPVPRLRMSGTVPPLHHKLSCLTHRLHLFCSSGSTPNRQFLFTKVLTSGVTMLHVSSDIARILASGAKNRIVHV